MQIVQMLLMMSATLLSMLWLGSQVDGTKHQVQHEQIQLQNDYFKEDLIPATRRNQIRSRRQLFRKKRKQSTFLSALNRLVYDTVNDTSIAYRNISTILADQFGGGNSMKGQMSISNETASGNATVSGMSSNRTASSLSMQQLFDLLGRNYRGLVKLFGREFRSAINDSNKNVARYRMELKDAVKPFFFPTRNLTSN